jgi:hypothetical protein
MCLYMFLYRYYSMDCNALHTNSKKGEYWAHASQQLVHNQALGMSFMKIALQPKSDTYDLSRLPSLELPKLTSAAESLKSGPFFRVYLVYTNTYNDFIDLHLLSI